MTIKKYIERVFISVSCFITLYSRIQKGRLRKSESRDLLSANGNRDSGLGGKVARILRFWHNSRLKLKLWKNKTIYIIGISFHIE